MAAFLSGSAGVPIEHATLSYGYGLSATQVQLARAYSVLASGGLLRPVTLKRQRGPVAGQRVMSEEISHRVNALLERVVSAEGTAKQASVSAYRVAGKTGTVHKVSPTGGVKQIDTRHSLLALHRYLILVLFLP